MSIGGKHMRIALVNDDKQQRHTLLEFVLNELSSTGDVAHKIRETDANVRIVFFTSSNDLHITRGKYKECKDAYTKFRFDKIRKEVEEQ